jgi:hypothetical protein
MEIFNLIVKKVINFDNNIFSLHYKNDNIENMIKISFKLLYENIENKYKSKFHFLHDTSSNFYFNNKTNEKNELLNVFCKIQRTYYILNKLCYMYKYNKSKIVVDTDLQLNKIKLTEPNIVCIYHIKNKYLFKLQELLKLIYTSLTNSYIHFSEPISIKNPYNNIPFGKSILYYIDYKLRTSFNINHIKPKYLDIFFKFRECNFDMTKFVDNYDYILREYSIQNYINNSTNEYLKNDIINIIKQFNKKIKNDDKKIFISEDFPDSELISIFKPYLYLYLVTKYSLVHKNKSEFNEKLFKKLTEFQHFNPQFGRKIIKLKGSIKKGKFKKIKSHIEFNTFHKKFESDIIEEFMNNHLSYKYHQNTIDNDIFDNYQQIEPNDGTIIHLNIVAQFIYDHAAAYQEEQEQEQEEYDEEQEEEEEQDEEEEEEYDDEEEEENDSIS